MCDSKNVFFRVIILLWFVCVHIIPLSYPRVDGNIKYNIKCYDVCFRSFTAVLLSAVNVSTPNVTYFSNSHV